MNKTIADVFEQESLDRSLLIGYYGGGNYGDELLLEVLMNLFKKYGIGTLTVTYQHMERFSTYHHQFGYEKIDMANKKLLLKAILNNKNIIIGGGGLWGLDVNPNIFLLSSLLFFSRFLLGKKIYLLGVGYYNSTSRLGHASAWLAGKSATHIIARDQEALGNFRSVTKNVSLDADIAWHIPSLDLQPYEKDFIRLEDKLHIKQNTLFITLRRFKPHQANKYAAAVEAYLADNRDRGVVLALMEPRSVDPDGYKLIARWQRRYRNVQVLDFSYNPLALFLLFRKYKKRIMLICPQFHVILVAHLTGVAFLPLAYDNKVSELLKMITKAKPIPIADISRETLQAFIDTSKRDMQ
jgi:polysaccharide pyruvyl transferase WcaK-like protein